LTEAGALPRSGGAFLTAIEARGVTSERGVAASLQAKRHETSLAVFNSANDVEAVAEQAGEAEIVGLSVCFQASSAKSVG